MLRALSVKTKALYGLGFAASGIKDGVFQVFLFFYFSQVLGLDARLTGLATVIALFFDAVSDPLVGSLSDNMKSGKWGRRHPWMFASAFPLGLSIYLLFLPPSGLSQLGLFAWMTVFTILARVAVTLFIVPAMSLGAELSEDYNERTSITTYRVVFAVIITQLVIIFGFIYYFVPTEDVSHGLLNEAAYPRYALLCGILIIFSILISTFGTADQIKYLPKPRFSATKTITQIIEGFKTALSLRSYRSLVGFTMVIFIGIGVGTTLTTYFVTYYFEFSEKQIAILPVATAISGVFTFVVTTYMSSKFDKRRTVIISTIIFGIFFSLPYLLRIIGFFPPNGHPLLIPIFFLTLVIAYLFFWVTISVVNSMMADVVDEAELKTGNREEGLYFSSMSFAYKCTVGIGYLVAGFLLKIISFPSQVDINEVSETAVAGLGWIGGFVLSGIYLSSIFVLRLYTIDKSRYEDIRRQLARN